MNKLLNKVRKEGIKHTWENAFTKIKSDIINKYDLYYFLNKHIRLYCIHALLDLDHVHNLNNLICFKLFTKPIECKKICIYFKNREISNQYFLPNINDIINIKLILSYGIIL